MPHPLRERAAGRLVHSVPLILFMDDVSGNVSKQWNKHYVVYGSNGNLPRQMLEKEFFTRFVASSPHVAPLELMKGVTDSVRCVPYLKDDCVINHSNVERLLRQELLLLTVSLRKRYS